ncbi:BnaAnng09240D [Brassica napus]|uniref:BnaAnng09240D protein n=1 Tax=Brassica napus TaxID=3708 RepID=A0A078ICP9_BRANA|nr:BnaAnng09240D [Brassica napus]
MDTRKRAGSFNSNGGGGGFKKSKQEMESYSTGLGSKSKPCTKFFSTSGCPFGDNCHFLHYVPGGYNAVAQLTNMALPMPQASRNMQGPGESGPGHVSSFGASATAKISVDASLAGAIIGKGGVSSKQICRQTGAKLSIQDHERDPNLKNIELEGTFEQINEASVMVRELIGRLNSAASRRPPGGGGEGKPHPGSNFKTKMCERFAKGNCTFGDRCHFAHGEAELRRSGVA